MESEAAKAVLAIASEVQRYVADCGLQRRATKRTEPLARPATAFGTGSPGNPSAFITWAHRSGTMSDTEAQEWERSVAEFATTLRQFGIDADLDLYHLSDRAVDWTRFGPQEIEQRDFVVIVMSSSWADRWKGTNPPYEGAGAAMEADALKGMFQRDQRAFQERVKIVVLPGQSDSDIPAELMRLTRYAVDPANIDTFDDLLRGLTSQPRYPIPELGVVPTLHPGVTAGMKKTPKSHLDADYVRLKRELERVDTALTATSDDDAPRRELLQRRAALQGILDAVSASDI